jgi:hypothetical protein
MDPYAYQGLLQDHVRQRQLTLWNTITKLYEIEDVLNAQVHKWIQEGTLSEKARAKTVLKSAVLRDDTQAVPRCS